MASFKTWLVMGLIVSASITLASNFYVGFAGQYGFQGTDLSSLSRTSQVLGNITTSQSLLLDKTNQVSTFGIFEQAYTAIGTIFNNFLNAFDLFWAMVNDFNDALGGGVIPAEVLTVIEGIVIITIVFFAMKMVFGGRFE